MKGSVALISNISNKTTNTCFVIDRTGKIVQRIGSSQVQNSYHFLKAQNIEKIDYFILTHSDEDHIGGAYKILEELEIGTLYMPKKDSF